MNPGTRFLTVLLLHLSTAQAGVHEMDSLRYLVQHHKKDTVVVNACNLISKEYWLTGNYDSADIFAQHAMEVANGIRVNGQRGWGKGKANAFNNLGICCWYRGEYDKALRYYRQALVIQKKSNDQLGTANSYNNIALVLFNKGKYAETVKYYFIALRIREKLKDSTGIAASYNNIAGVYYTQGKFRDALVHYGASHKIRVARRDNWGIIVSCNNIGLMYQNLAMPDSAIYFYNKGIEKALELDNKLVVGSTYNNMGISYASLGKYEEALACHRKAVDILSLMGDKEGVATSYLNMGDVFNRQKKYGQAKKILLQSLAQSKAIGSADDIRVAYNYLMVADSGLGNYKGAFMYMKLFIRIRDSLNNVQINQKMLDEQLQTKYERKAAADSVTNARQKEIQAAEIARQHAEIKAKRNQQYALYGGLFLLIVFALFMYNRFRLTRKQKTIIEAQRNEVQRQKEIVEEKHKEITDSINYAERIQRSFLASTEMMRHHLPSHFILFRPRDVVSGDFYWCDKTHDGHFLLAVADSTGHGVPGAIMSILNITCLENAVKDGANVPAHILDHTRKNIIERLKKDGTAEGGKDGMDACLLRIDTTNGRIQFALANNPLWIIRRGELLEFEGDKMPVGKHDKQDIPFTHHGTGIEKNDLVFIFTDGYADQFGGPKAKKFKYAQLKQILLENASQPVDIIHKNLENRFEEWRGNLEQVDDVCIIGIRF